MDRAVAAMAADQDLAPGGPMPASGCSPRRLRLEGARPGGDRARDRGPRRVEGEPQAPGQWIMDTLAEAA